MNRSTRVLLVLGGLLAARPALAQMPNAGPSLTGGLYLRGGRMTARGDYAALPGATGTVFYSEASAAPMLGSGTGAGTGYYGELGRIHYLPLPLVPIVKVGIDATLSAGYMDIAWDDVYPDAYTDEAYGELLADARVGPVLSVMPLPGLRFDAAAKVGFGVAAGSSVSVSGAPLDDGRFVDFSDRHDTGATGMSRSFSLAVRYAGLVVGWEAHSMRVERERSYEVRDSEGRSAEFTYASSVSPTTSRIFVGISR